MVRDLDDDVLKQLKAAAKAHGRRCRRKSTKSSAMRVPAPGRDATPFGPWLKRLPVRRSPIARSSFARTATRGERLHRRRQCRRQVVRAGDSQRRGATSAHAAALRLGHPTEHAVDHRRRPTGGCAEEVPSSRRPHPVLFRRSSWIQRIRKNRRGQDESPRGVASSTRRD